MQLSPISIVIFTMFVSLHKRGKRSYQSPFLFWRNFRAGISITHTNKLVYYIQPIYYVLYIIFVTELRRKILSPFIENIMFIIHFQQGTSPKHLCLWIHFSSFLISNVYRNFPLQKVLFSN